MVQPIIETRIENSIRQSDLFPRRRIEILGRIPYTCVSDNNKKTHECAFSKIGKKYLIIIYIYPFYLKTHRLVGCVYLIGGKQSPPVSGQQLNPWSPMSV